MLDIVKYHYIDLGLPNLKGQWSKDKEDPASVDMTIYPFMQPFIFEAAKLFPMWEFIGKRVRYHVRQERDTLEFYQFDVYDNREKIGTLDYEVTNKGESFALTNDRIENKRERGRSARTRDIKKALKILSKEFGAKKIDERLSEAQRACSHALESFHHDRERQFDRVYAHIVNCLESHIMGNWDTVKEVALSNGAEAKAVDAAMGFYEDYKISKLIRDAFNKKEGVVAIIHGNDYAVRDNDGMRIYGTDTLPDWIKRGIGMLKLIERQNIISNVGFKIDEHAFFIMKGAE